MGDVSRGPAEATGVSNKHCRSKTTMREFEALATKPAARAHRPGEMFVAGRARIAGARWMTFGGRRQLGQRARSSGRLAESHAGILQFTGFAIKNAP
jgi:hypothetical protein